jgi:uncharacterized membrane protein YqjE
MNNGQKIIVVTVLVVILSGYGWGWTVRPQLRYELLSQTNYVTIAASVHRYRR